MRAVILARLTPQHICAISLLLANGSYILWPIWLAVLALPPEGNVTRAIVLAGILMPLWSPLVMDVVFRVACRNNVIDDALNVQRHKMYFTALLMPCFVCLQGAFVYAFFNGDPSCGYGYSGNGLSLYSVLQMLCIAILGIMMLVAPTLTVWRAGDGVLQADRYLRGKTRPASGQPTAKEIPSHP